jgi:hypothetical protein
MTLIAILLYLLGAVTTLVLVDIELQDHKASAGGKLFATIIACAIWPLIILYALVSCVVDWALSLMKR